MNIKYSISKKLLKQLYLKEMKSIQQIADLFGAGKSTIRTLLMKYTIPRRLKIVKITKKYLIHEYTIKKLTMHKIAVNSMCSDAGVFKLLKKYNIQTRDRSSHVRWNKNKSGYKAPGAGFKKGSIPWNKGLTKGTDSRIINFDIKRLQSRVYETGISWGHHTDEAKRKLSLSHGGTGIPYEKTEYGPEFDSALKEQVRFRDHYKCQICGCSQLENGKQLDVHHIDYDKLNNILMNLISLCMRCHRKTNTKRNDWFTRLKLFMLNLYQLT